jgi:4-amino-4-deoxy-L-arabinose transferase-like glycosyltransferase
VLVFLAVFVPWMIAVAKRCPHAWDLWNWQYLQRFEGDYEDTRVRGVFYYVPIVLGLLLPWTLSLLEGLAAPWMRRYQRMRRQLLYVGLWGVLGVVVMSLMEFKKPYYVVPAIPGLLLLLAVAVERFFWEVSSSKTVRWLGWGGLVAGLSAAVIGGHLYSRANMPLATGRLTMMAAAGAVLLSAAGLMYVFGRGRAAFAAVAVIMVVAFHLVWYTAGPTVDKVDRVAALARELDAVGVPDDATVYWADRRPDARLGFYFGRRSAHLVEPADIVTRMVDRTGADAKLEQMALERARELLDRPHPVYLILYRRNFDRFAELLADRAHRLGLVDLEGQPDAADRVVVGNGLAVDHQAALLQ